MADVAVSTDIIVGFPGETESDFQDTLDLVERARFDSAYTFQYSPRPGTVAASLDGQVPPDVVKERFARLVALQERISLERSTEQVPPRRRELARTGSCTWSRRSSRDDSCTPAWSAQHHII